MSEHMTALQKIENAQKTGALVFVDQGGMAENTPLYKLDVTAMQIDKEKDCFLISGKYMPKREIVDRIGDACGISFIFGETKAGSFDDGLGKRLVYTGFAQGQKLLPDGTYRQSSICTYDFDYVLRALLDFDETELTAQTKQKRRISGKGVPYGSTLARYIFELQKVASQRANTGARLRVIRELAGIPESFAVKDLEQPLYFGRMIQNTDYILKTPEGRAMATAKALGMDMSTLFGGRQFAEPAQTQPEMLPAGNTFAGKQADDDPPEHNTAALAGEAASEEPEFPDPHTAAEKTEFERMTGNLLEFLDGYKTELNVVTPRGNNPYKLAEAELANPSATVETRDAMIVSLRGFLKAKGIDV